MEGAEGCGGLVHHPLDVFGLAEVCLDGQDTPGAGRIDLRTGRLQHVRPTGADRDIGALRGQR